MTIFQMDDRIPPSYWVTVAGVGLSGLFMDRLSEWLNITYFVKVSE